MALFFVTMMATLPLILGKLGATPHNPNKVKNSTYECGLETTGKSRFQFNFRYYCFAILFVTLDVMAVFLLPWAVAVGKLGELDDSGEDALFVLEGDGLFALVGVGIFILILAIGYIYAWKKRLLEWM